jgi:precorrin-6Y C5,15-methyltransferase (decarboxylating)
MQERIAQADHLWGGERLLAQWPDHPAGRTIIKSNVEEMVERLQGRGSARVVVLASGDPGFYGIVGTLLRHLLPNEVEIVPHVSSLQLAFARAGVDWNDAIFTSAHARPLSEIVGWARRARKLGVLTDTKNTPGQIAQTLLDAGLDDCRAIVAENLGLPDERIADTYLSTLRAQSFGPLNVLLLLRDADWRPQATFGPRPDDAYAHRRGLITKADVRALSLARLALCETDTAWDIGAGSGAMSVEMAELAWRGRVFAVEHDTENLGYVRQHDTENLGYVRQNAARFGALNVEVVAGRAPAALKGLPAPNAVFVGGTGGEMVGILAQIERVAVSGCRVVINLATLENLTEALETMRAHNWSPQVTQVSVAHGKDVGGRTRLAPLNPVFIVHTAIR